MVKQFQKDKKGKRFYTIDSYPLDGICLYHGNYDLSDDFRELDTRNLQGRLRGSQAVCALQVRTPRIDRGARELFANTRYAMRTEFVE